MVRLKGPSDGSALMHIEPQFDAFCRTEYMLVTRLRISQANRFKRRPV